jgi:hypothetical protein
MSDYYGILYHVSSIVGWLPGAARWLGLFVAPFVGFAFRLSDRMMERGLLRYCTVRTQMTANSQLTQRHLISLLQVVLELRKKAKLASLPLFSTDDIDYAFREAT